MLFWLRRWATPLGRTKIAAYSVRMTAERAGRKSYTRTTSRVQRTCVSNRGTPALFMRRCGTAFESQDRRELPPDPEAAFINPPTKELPGRKSPATDCLREIGAVLEWRLQRERAASAFI